MSIFGQFLYTSPRVDIFAQDLGASSEMRPVPPRQALDQVFMFQQDGDVLIQIGDYKLLVTSEGLSWASPVFAAMLGGAFREGIKTPFRGRQVHHVSLPDDDIDAVLLLCKIIYGRHDLIKSAPSGQTLLKFAVLCDKYQCAEALKPEVEPWMEKSYVYYGSIDRQEACTLLLASYIFDYPETFKTLSLRILRQFRWRGHKKKDRLTWYLMMQHPLVNADLAGEFEAKHKFLKKQIKLSFERPFSRLKKCTCQNNPNVRAKKAASFSEQLFNANLMPADIQWVFITDIIQRVDGLPNVACHHYKSCWFRAGKSLKEILQEQMRWIESHGIGLCLDCIKRFQNGHCPSHPPAEIPTSRYF